MAIGFSWQKKGMGIKKVRRGGSGNWHSGGPIPLRPGGWYAQGIAHLSMAGEFARRLARSPHTRQAKTLVWNILRRRATVSPMSTGRCSRPRLLTGRGDLPPKGYINSPGKSGQGGCWERSGPIVEPQSSRGEKQGDKRGSAALVCGLSPFLCGIIAHCVYWN